MFNMPNTPHDSVDTLPVKHQALPPPEIVDDIESESYHIIADLTPLQQKVLLTLVKNTLSEDIRTDAAIAAECGTSKEYVWQLRQKPKFARSMGLLIREVIRGTQDKALTLLWKHAQKDPGSVKLLLEMGGTYERTQRNLNINATIGGRRAQSMSISETVDSILIRLGELGWSDERVSSLVDRFRELRAEGAF